jgi:hypothetical protein
MASATLRATYAGAKMDNRGRGLLVPLLAATVNCLSALGSLPPPADTPNPNHRLLRVTHDPAPRCAAPIVLRQIGKSRRPCCRQSAGGDGEENRPRAHFDGLCPTGGTSQKSIGSSDQI